eukprot:PhF_6_TR8984/c0_g1_i1/m.14111/K07881/RAB14; Ras-related protein Rab-14
MAHKYIFKYIIIGDMGVGKSCLLHQFTDHKFLADNPHTIGVEFGTRVIEVGGECIKLQIWDTAGQDRFRAVTRSYYRGAAGALIVYDITRRSSYTHVTTWLADCRELTGPNTVIILVGNKNDSEQTREVSFEEAQRFAHENHILFLECSAKTGKNVEDVFLKTARGIYDHVVSGVLDPNSVESGIQLGRTAINYPPGGGNAQGGSTDKKEKKGCC